MTRRAPITNEQLRALRATVPSGDGRSVPVRGALLAALLDELLAYRMGSEVTDTGGNVGEDVAAGNSGSFVFRDRLPVPPQPSPETRRRIETDNWLDEIEQYLAQLRLRNYKRRQDTGNG